MEHELWFTAILNKILGGPVAALLADLGHPAADAAHPIPNYIAMEILVALVILVGAILLRRQLSVEIAWQVPADHGDGGGIRPRHE